MINDLFGEVAKISDRYWILANHYSTPHSSLTPQQRLDQIAAQAKALQALAETVENLARSGDKAAMNGAAQKIAAAAEQLVGYV